MAPALETIVQVLDLASKVAAHSWEYGTVFQAKLDWYNPELSVWSTPFPDGQLPKVNVDEVDALRYIRDGKSEDGPWVRLDGDTLIKDGSAGDPASLGIPVLLIGQSNPTENIAYTKAAENQQKHLTEVVTRWPGGAISHRESHPELWSDSMYMVPPFLAYYGVATQNVTLVNEAATQCKLYRDVLKSPSGPWHHISGPYQPKVPGVQSDGESYDLQLWATGNGWAVAGMARVIATMRNSPYDGDTKENQGMLSGFIQEIIESTKALDSDPNINQKAEGFLLNYLNDTSSYGEIAGTALISATVFRMAVLEPNTFGQYTGWAEAKMGKVDGAIQRDGKVVPVVNPLGWWEPGAYWEASPEGQSFVVLMHAAYRDWQKANGQSTK